jgi:hypothetical protein
MRATTQRLPDIGSQHADVGSLAASHAQGQQIAGKIQAVDGMDGHRPRLALDFDTLAGQFVERPAIALERRMHGRNLQDVAGEIGSTPKICAFTDLDRSIRDHLPFGIAGIGRHAKLDSAS